MFDREFFEIPHGRKEDWLFDQFKEKLLHEGMPSSDEMAEFAERVKDILDEGRTTIGSE
jgi:hypothetical protein